MSVCRVTDEIALLEPSPRKLLQLQPSWRCAARKEGGEGPTGETPTGLVSGKHNRSQDQVKNRTNETGWQVLGRYTRKIINFMLKEKWFIWEKVMVCRFFKTLFWRITTSDVFRGLLTCRAHVTEYHYMTTKQKQGFSRNRLGSFTSSQFQYQTSHLSDLNNYRAAAALTSHNISIFDSLTLIQLIQLQFKSHHTPGHHLDKTDTTVRIMLI